MKVASFVTLAILILPASSLCAAEEPGPRVLVLTDIENEPDDAMSMVRFLVYSNQWDVEGLVATTSVHQQDETAAVAHPRDRQGLRRGAGQSPPARDWVPAGRCADVRDPGRPTGLRHGRRWRGHGIAGLTIDHRGRRSRRSPAALGAGVGRSQCPRTGIVEGPRHAFRRGTREVRLAASCLHDL